MPRKISYSGHSFTIADDISAEQAKTSLTEIFPELINSVALDDGEEIHFVLSDRMRQNLLDMELRHTKIKKMQRELDESLRRREVMLYKTRSMSHVQRHLYIEAERERGQRKIHEEITKQQEYPYKIGGHYAKKGNYEHLVGKSIKVVEENVELGAYIVKVEGDDEEYLIRQKDIILKEMDEV